MSSFNDPFECMYRATGEMTPQKAKNYLRSRLDSPNFLAEIRRQAPKLKSDKAARRFVKANQARAVAGLVANYELAINRTLEDREALLDRSMRVVCFSKFDAEPLDEILMWSHYAAHHKGTRIGFEFPPDITYPFKISPITYQKDRVALDLSVNAESSEVQEALLKSIKTKSEAWSYEGEHRLLTTPELCFKGKSLKGEILEFIGIEKAWVKRVDFGARYPSAEIVSFVSFLKNEYPHVECYQTKYHQTDYALEYRKL